MILLFGFLQSNGGNDATKAINHLGMWDNEHV